MPRKPTISKADQLLGRRIEAFRLYRGMSRQQLGQKVNNLVQQIDKYENGAFMPIDKLEEIAEVLDARIPKKLIRKIVTARKLEFETGQPREELIDFYNETFVIGGDE